METDHGKDKAWRRQSPTGKEKKEEGKERNTGWGTKEKRKRTRNTDVRAMCS